jgi:hypothetical protein
VSRTRSRRTKSSFGARLSLDPDGASGAGFVTMGGARLERATSCL